MDKEQIIAKTADFVMHGIEQQDVGHDWYHTERVWKIAKYIAREEKTDTFIIELAALLHDIADWKFHGPGAGGVKARQWLETIGVKREDSEHVIHIIENISFKGAGEKNNVSTPEGRIVQDADRLDALGAIGIARSFAFAGFSHIPICVPGVEPRKNMSVAEYSVHEKSAINHFYEKLLLIKDRMNTKTGKTLAEDRHKFLEIYLEQFFKEVGGER